MSVSFAYLVLSILVSAVCARGIFVDRASASLPVVIDVQNAYDAPFLLDVHPRERGPGGWFRWTKARSSIVLQNLPPGPVEVLARLHVPRRPEPETTGNPPSELRFSANGATVHRVEAGVGLRSITYDFPFQGGPLVLSIESPTFDAGGRELGVQIQDIQVLPTTRRVPWRRPTAGLVLAAAIVFLGFSIAGVPAWTASVISLVFAGIGARLIAERGLVFTGYTTSLVWIACFGLFLSVALRLWARTRRFLVPSQRKVFVGAALASFLWKLTFVTYPFLITSDGAFHANRLAGFMRGNWWMSSVTQHQPPFDIPYPFSFFAAGSLLAWLGLDLLLVVKLVVVFSETVAVMAIMYLAFRFLNDALIAVMAAAIYQLIPMGTLALSAGNFSNLFAVGVATLSLAALLATDTDGGPRRWLWAAAASFVALTAHFGMLIEGALLWPAWILAICLFAPAPVHARTRRQMIWAAAMAAVFTLVYYAGYLELITSQWERALSRDYAMGGQASGSPMDKLAFNISFLRETIGILLPVLAGAGAYQVFRNGWTSPLQAAAAAWLITTVLFFGVDLLSAIEIRYVLQSLPLLALLAAVHLAHAWRRGRTGKTAVLLASGYLLYVSIPVYLDCLLTRYHSL